MKQIYFATVKIAIEANSDGEACDAISETLRPLMGEAIIDWEYTTNADRSIINEPEYIGAFPDEMDEGDVFWMTPLDDSKELDTQ